MAKITVRTRKLKDGRQSIYLDVYHHKGKRYYENLDLCIDPKGSNKKEMLRLANNVRNIREREIIEGKYDQSRQAERTKFFEVFEEHVKLRKNTQYGSLKKALLIFTKNNLDLRFSDIDFNFGLKFMTHVKNNLNLKPNTILNYQKRFSAVLNFAVKKGIIPANPIKHLEVIKKEEVKKDFLTVDEIKKLADTTCKSRDVKRAFLFACFTGLRFSDCKKLTWAEVDLDNRHLTFRQKKTSGLNYLSLSEMAVKFLFLNYSSHLKRKPETLVFDKLPSAPAAFQTIKLWVKHSGIKKNVSFHTARHTFAILLLSNKTDLYTVSKMMGHASLKTTELYLKVLDEKVTQAAEGLPTFNLNNESITSKEILKISYN